MKNKVGSKLFFRLKFLILHPARSCRHLLSKKSDYSKIPLFEIQNYLSEPKTIIEAGAADGVDTLNFSSHFPLATVFAIEPVIEGADKREVVSKACAGLYVKLPLIPSP